MTTIPATPKFVRNLSVLIGTDEYNLHVSDFQIKPSPVKWKGGTDTANYVDFTYELTLKLVHDYQSETSLFNFLIAHAGEAATFIYKPDVTATFAATTTAQIVPPTIGGPVNKYNESTVTMDCSKPTFADLTQ